MNNVVLIGRLTKDPELAYGGQNRDIAVCRFTLAVDRPTQDNSTLFRRRFEMVVQLQPVDAVPLVQGELDRPERRKESFVFAL